MLYKEGLEFDTAIEFMRRALELEPDNTVAMTNLATTMSRCGYRSDPKLTQFGPATT